MAFWNGRHWTTDPEEQDSQARLTRSRGRRRRQTWFDWIMTATMIVALPLAAVAATQRATAGLGAPSLDGDVGISTDGVAATSDGTGTAMQWAGYEWRGRPPVQVGVKSYLTSPGLASAAVAAAASWSRSAVVDVVMSAGGKRGIEIYEGDYGPDQHAAWTMVTKRNGYVSAVRIFINTYKLGTASPWVMEFALCHELGHALGLDHQMAATEASCLSPDLPGTAPNATDFRQLELIYQR